MAKLNRFCDAKMLFLNSWSNTPESKAKIGGIKGHAIEKGIPRENIIFSSEMGPQWEKGVRHEVVMDMFQIANLFVFPSMSETFS